MAHGAPRDLSFVMAAAAPRGGASFGGGADGVGALSGHGFNASGYFVRQRFGFGRLARRVYCGRGIGLWAGGGRFGRIAPRRYRPLARQPVMRHKRAYNHLRNRRMGRCEQKGNLMSEPKPRVLSGVQPTGNLHLGNYLGAIRNFVEMQNSHECLYCVVDLHAITVFQDPQELAANTREVAAAFIAAGVDPKNHIVFNQAQVPQHAELAWVLNCGEDGLAQSDDAI